MRVAVIGVGGVGGVLASACAMAGHEVIAVARGAQAKALTDRGLVYVDRAGRDHCFRVTVADVEQTLEGCDIAIVALKAQGVARHASQIARQAGACPITVFVQNGLPWWYLGRLSSMLADYDALDPNGILADGFPDPSGAIVHFGAEVTAAGCVRCTAPGRFRIAASRSRDEPVRQLADAVASAGYETEILSDLGQAIWEKLVVNVPLNLLAGVTNLSISQMLSDKHLVQVLNLLAGDISRLAGALGHNVQFDVHAQLSITGLDQVSSTLQDMRGGRPIEYDALFGAPLALARRLGVPAPVLEAMVPLLKSNAMMARYAQGAA